MTKQELLDTVKENMKDTFDDSSKYNNRKKLKESKYYVQCVVNEIGKVAFLNDYNLTKEIENELVESFFNKKSIKEYGKIMQDAFKSAVWAGFDCVSLSNNDYTQEDVERFNKESEEPIFDLCIEGGMETADEIDDITFLGAFALCFEESKNI